MNLHLMIRALLAATWLALAGCAAVPSAPPPPAATPAGPAAASARVPDAAPVPAPAPATVAAASAASASSASVPATSGAPVETIVLPSPAASSASANPAVLAPLPIDLVPAPELRADPHGSPLPKLTEEEETAQRADLWARVRKGFAMPALDNDLVRKWEQYYASRPDYVARMTERGGRYLFHIVEEVEKRGMPSELALLPFVESAFNPQATSSARASGMWQFMPATGRDFELKQNLFRDDRRSVLASTRAALDYLQSLYGMFGDWQHALAAYNWGQGNVQRAVARNQKAGSSTAYEALSMPDETRNYVPKLQAIKNLVQRPDAFNVKLPPLENHPFFLSVPIERDIDVALAVRLAGLTLDEFQQLNPQMNKPVILAAGTPHLLLPFDNAKHFVRELARHRGPLATWTAWVAPRTLKPSEAARSVGMSEAHLREVNRIPPRMLVKVGSTLLVPRAASSTRDVSEHVADTASILLAPEPVPGRKRIVKAGPRGETVAAMARRLRVSPANLARWNGVGTGATFKPQQAVVLMLPPARPAAKGRAAPAATQRGVAKAAPPQAKRTAVRQAPARAKERVAKR